MSSDDTLARYARKVNEDIGATVLIESVAEAVRPILEGSGDLAGLVRALIGTEFRAANILLGGGREEDLQMATAVVLHRCATGGSLPLYMRTGAHWYALPGSFFTSKAMWDRTPGRTEEARPVAFGSWVNGRAHGSDFASGDDSNHLAVVQLPYPVQTTIAGEAATLGYARQLVASPAVATREPVTGPSSREEWLTWALTKLRAEGAGFAMRAVARTIVDAQHPGKSPQDRAKHIGAELAWLKRRGADVMAQAAKLGLSASDSP